MAKEEGFFFATTARKIVIFRMASEKFSPFLLLAQYVSGSQYASVPATSSGENLA